MSEQDHIDHFGEAEASLEFTESADKRVKVATGRGFDYYPGKGPPWDHYTSWSPASLFASGENGDYWNFSDSSLLYQDVAKLTQVLNSGDVIGAAVGLRGVLDFTQALSGDKPIWTQLGHANRFGVQCEVSGDRRFLEITNAGLSGTARTIAIYGHLYGASSGGDSGKSFGRFISVDDGIVDETLTITNVPSTQLIRSQEYVRPTSYDLYGNGIYQADIVAIAAQSGGNHYLDVRRYTGSELAGTDTQQVSGARTNGGSRVYLGYTTNNVNPYQAHISRALVLDRLMTEEEKTNWQTWAINGDWT